MPDGGAYAARDPLEASAFERWDCLREPSRAGGQPYAAAAAGMPPGSVTGRRRRAIEERGMTPDALLRELPDADTEQQRLDGDCEAMSSVIGGTARATAGLRKPRRGTHPGRRAGFLMAPSRPSWTLRRSSRCSMRMTRDTRRRAGFGTTWWTAPAAGAGPWSPIRRWWWRRAPCWPAGSACGRNPTSSRTSCGA